LAALMQVVLEHNASLVRQMRAAWPQLDIRLVRFGGLREPQLPRVLLSVLADTTAAARKVGLGGWRWGTELPEESTRLLSQALPQGGLPADISDEHWDVIVVGSSSPATAAAIDSWYRRALSSAGRILGMGWLTDEFVHPDRVSAIWTSVALANGALTRQAAAGGDTPAAMKRGVDILVHGAERWSEMAISTAVLGRAHTVVGGAHLPDTFVMHMAQTTPSLMAHYNVQ